VRNARGCKIICTEIIEHKTQRRKWPEVGGTDWGGRISLRNEKKDIPRRLREKKGWQHDMRDQEKKERNKLLFTCLCK